MNKLWCTWVLCTLLSLTLKLIGMQLFIFTYWYDFIRSNDIFQNIYINITIIHYTLKVTHWHYLMESSCLFMHKPNIHLYEIALTRILAREFFQCHKTHIRNSIVTFCRIELIFCVNKSWCEFNFFISFYLF